MPDEFTMGERDPESRKYNENQYVLDSGARLATRRLAGATGLTQA